MKHEIAEQLLEIKAVFYSQMIHLLGLQD